MNSKIILNNLELMIKNPKCELNYTNDWQLLIAILLSAQSTDKKVNSVTPILFSKYPNLENLKNADFNELKEIINPIGLANNKARNIINLAKALIEKHNGKVPSKKEQLISLPGIGNKTANVMLIEYFKIPAFPVDTHVARVSKRLNLCNKTDSIQTIENKLMATFDKKEWALLHLRMVLFGRYICKAIKPDCKNCLFKESCKHSKSTD